MYCIHSELFKRHYGCLRKLKDVARQSRRMESDSDGEEAPFCFWTPEVLAGLRFDNNKLLLDHLKIEALKFGFDIAFVLGWKPFV